MLKPNRKNVPTKLTECRQWIPWKNEHERKIPCQENGKPASVSDPSTWTTLDGAWEAYERGGYDGIGFVFTKDDPFVGVDLDGCRHPRQGLAPWAQAIVERLNSYTEISPSGYGVHIIVRGSSPFLTGRKIDLSAQQGSEGGKKAGIEVYDHGRYFCITGQMLEGVVARDVESFGDWESISVLPPAHNSGQPQPVPPATVVPSAPAQPVTAPKPWERPATSVAPAQEPASAAQTALGSVGQVGVDLERRIRRATAYVDAYPPAISGQGGHATTLYLVQNLVHRFDLPENVALQVLQSYNQRCQPEWSEKELAHKIQQAHEHPADKAAEWEAEELAEQAAEAAALTNGAESARSLLAEYDRKTGLVGAPASATVASEPQPSIVLASDWLMQEPPPVESIIPGLLDRGDKFFVVGQSKLGKSFFALMLALCLAAGRDFLCWKPRGRQRVLVLQFELKSAHYWRRVRRVASALGITPADIGDRLDILNLRGKASQLDALRFEDYDAVLFDPLFKLADRAGADENTQKDMARLLGGFDAICERGPAVIIIHHGTKGRIGDRQAIDRASGSGVIARDFDGMFTLAPHADNPGDWLVLETVLRNYRSPEAKTLEFQDCSFIVRDDVPPEVETSDSVRRAKQSGPSVEALSATVGGWISGPGPEETTPLIDRMQRELHVGVGKAKAVLRHLESLGYTRGKTSEFPAKSIITPPLKPLVQGNLSFLLQSGQTRQTE
ncbi:MAG: AAA family ATPase [Planctomycetaceae bacterium]|nr:AAA family ATPase [Planctomycetaceae bacterium]